MAKLQMVSGKTYSDPRVNGGSEVKLGDIIEVENDAVAEDLKSLFYLDGVDRECAYFAAYDAENKPAVAGKRRTAPAKVAE